MGHGDLMSQAEDVADQVSSSPRETLSLSGYSGSTLLPNSVKMLVFLCSSVHMMIQQTPDLLWQQFVVVKTNFYSLLDTTANFVPLRSLVQKM